MQVSWDVALNLNFTKGELNLLQVIFFFPALAVQINLVLLSAGIFSFYVFLISLRNNYFQHVLLSWIVLELVLKMIVSLFFNWRELNSLTQMDFVCRHSSFNVLSFLFEDYTQKNKYFIFKSVWDVHIFAWCCIFLSLFSSFVLIKI